MNFIHFYFAPTGQAWYMGAIYGNILASILWSSPIWIFTLWRLEVHHKKAERHRRRVEKHLGIKGE